MRLYVIVIFLNSTATTCLGLPLLQNWMVNLSNNSYIFYGLISPDESAPLKCLTNTTLNCCNDDSVGNWRDVRGSPVQEGRDGTSCLYVTRGDGEISLNRRNSNCSPQSSGLWRCDIPDSSGDMQSLYIYIGNYNNDAYGYNFYTILLYIIDHPFT